MQGLTSGHGDSDGERLQLGYTQVATNRRGLATGGKLWFARRAPGDGGADWEYTDRFDLAGVFRPTERDAWLELHSSTGFARKA